MILPVGLIGVYTSLWSTFETRSPNINYFSVHYRTKNHKSVYV